MRRNRISNILAFLALATPIAAISNRPNLFERASTCADKTFTQCQGVPDNFCCPTNTNCLVLASNTTVLCCPSGQSCSLIQTIVCDISQQNATTFPTAQLKTSNLTATLPTCGERCCPLGYSCTGTNAPVCALNHDQGSSPGYSTFAATASSTPTIAPANSVSSSTPTSTTASAAGANDSCTSSPITTSCQKFPAGAILAGFFPGLALGALLAILSICLLGARRNSRNSPRPQSNSSFGKVSASISDPIYHEGSTMRTDFIRKIQDSRQGTPTRQPTIQRVRSLFRKSAASTASNGNNNTDIYLNNQPSPAPPVPLVPRPPVSPRTPRMQREPSGESINIFTDPSTARSMDQDRDWLRVGGRDMRASGQTTFTDMMERAELGGVRRGEGFVETPSPGQRWR